MFHSFIFLSRPVNFFRAIDVIILVDNKKLKNGTESECPVSEYTISFVRFCVNDNSAERRERVPVWVRRKDAGGGGGGGP